MRLPPRLSSWLLGAILAQATYNYVLNALKLKATAGVLGEDDLAHINQWLQK